MSTVGPEKSSVEKSFGNLVVKPFMPDNRLTKDVWTSKVHFMTEPTTRYSPGYVRDTIFQVMQLTSKPLSPKQVGERVTHVLGDVPMSSIRSYLHLNTPELFARESRGLYTIKRTAGLQCELDQTTIWEKSAHFGRATLHHADCFDWIDQTDDCSIHAVVTDPPYGLHEYTPEEQAKLRRGRGGVWRIPPSYDGHARAPLPRFTTLTQEQLRYLHTFFFVWTRLLLPKLVPGAHVLVASNPLLSFIVSGAMADAGLERRGEIIRLTMTMRGGDRPKAAHKEFRHVSVMPRSMWEPWLVYRKPLEGRVQDNLRKWGTGGFRRLSTEKPFGDVIESAPTRKNERVLAPHPSLKPQAFLRQIVRAALPLKKGTILDPFAGAGSTLAAAEAVGYRSIGVEKDVQYFRLAREAIPRLIAFKPNGNHPTR